MTNCMTNQRAHIFIAIFFTVDCLVALMPHTAHSQSRAQLYSRGRGDYYDRGPHGASRACMPDRLEPSRDPCVAAMTSGGYPQQRLVGNEGVDYQTQHVYFSVPGFRDAIMCTQRSTGDSYTCTCPPKR